MAKPTTNDDLLAALITIQQQLSQVIANQLIEQQLLNCLMVVFCDHTIPYKPKGN